jgi:N-acetylmuramoyl-L-alanine amidase
MIFPSEPQFVVVIDPGHGGKDPGAVRGVYKEKDINLSVAIMLGSFIEQNYEDVKVVYTRKKDVFVDLKKRAEIANKAKANLFISIHTNSTVAKTTQATGADTYILGIDRSPENLEVAKRENSVILLEDNYSTKYQGFDPNSTESYIIFEFMTNKYMEQSLQLAGLIQKDFKNVAKRTDRGVRQSGFLVLRESSMPSVLIELGFINNPVEAKYLSSQLGQRAMATAIYSGFKNYKREFDKRQGVLTVSKIEKTEEKNVILPKEKEVVNIKPEEVITVNKTIEPELAQTGTLKKTIEEKSDTVKILTKDNFQPYPQAGQQPKKTENEIKQEESIKNIIVASNTSLPKQVAKKEEVKTTVVKDEPAKEVTATTVAKSLDHRSNAGLIEYRIQFLISTRKLAAGASELKGLPSTDYYEEGGYYKYTYGKSANYKEITGKLTEVKAKFKDAFIVQFRDGKRVK